MKVISMDEIDLVMRGRLPQEGLFEYEQTRGPTPVDPATKA